MVSGDGCEVQRGCVSSLGYPNAYGNVESCSITINENVDVTVGPVFDMQTCCDDLIINGLDTEFSGAVPKLLLSSSEISWSADSGEVGAGWQLCFTLSGKK